MKIEEKDLPLLPKKPASTIEVVREKKNIGGSGMFASVISCEPVYSAAQMREYASLAIQHWIARKQAEQERFDAWWAQNVPQELIRDEP